MRTTLDRDDLVAAVKDARTEVRAALRSRDDRRIADAWGRLEAVETIAAKELGKQAVREIDRNWTWRNER